jgi:hypothetical protein
MDVPDHIAHGDCIAACTGGTDKGKSARLGEQAVANYIKVYPNPARGIININLGTNTQNIRRVDIVDISGRLVMQMNVGKVQTLTISGDRLKAGTYIIRLHGDKIMTEKLVVQ